MAIFRGLSLFFASMDKTSKATKPRIHSDKEFTVSNIGILPSRKCRYSERIIVNSRLFIILAFLLFPLYLSRLFFFTSRTSSITEILPLTFTASVTQNVNPPFPPTTRLLKQPQYPGSRGESIRVHKPFLLYPYTAHDVRATFNLNNHTLSCAAYKQSDGDLPLSNCTEYLSSQNWQNTTLHYDDMLRNSNNITVPDRCANSSALIFFLIGQDRNVCHALMKLLVGFSILQRQQHNSQYLGVPPIAKIILVTLDSKLRHNLLARQPRHQEDFHLGLARTIFRPTPSLQLIVVPSLNRLRADSSAPVCFSAGILVQSYANRFSLPDQLMGDFMAYEGKPSLPFPLSSDGLALRAHVFHPQQPPRMRNQVLYVHRLGPRRRWTDAGETKFRSLLKDLTTQEQVQLLVFEGGSNQWPTFWEQVRYYADASVIIGFHGAGLASTVFAPRGAALIEIEPEDHQLNLFGHLQSSGIIYDMIKLSKGTSRGEFEGSDLNDSDASIVRGLLRSRIRDGKRLVSEQKQ